MESRLTHPLSGAVLALVLVLAGCGWSPNSIHHHVRICGPSLNGTYHQAGGAGLATLEFKSNKVTMTFMGESKQGTYEIKGDQVILHMPGEGDIKLRLNDDGTLDSPLGTFKKG